MKPVQVIAEAGVNYNGRIELAKEMVYIAKECGADVIKFQTAKAELVMSKYAEKADYQKKATGVAENQLEMCRKLFLPYEDFAELSGLCKQVGIGFLSTPFEIESINFLHELGMDMWKIPSGEITNLPYLEEIGRFGQKIILSTGMSNLQEVEDAVKVLLSAGAIKEDITLLHCTTEYPAPYSDVNLNAMLTLKNKFGMKVGYSDHTQGIVIPIAAVSMGAEIIEKHFTLDKNMEGPDHKASLEPEELKEMISAIRKVEIAFGDGDKAPQPSEIKNIPVARKSIIAKQAIKRGQLFTEENLTTKRPGNGISPMKWYDVLGTKAIRDFAEDDLVKIDDKE